MSRARLWLKISGVLVLVAVLAAGAALVALKALFPEPKARAYVVDAARRQLGRDVRLTRIDAGLTGLRLQGLEISERPDFAAGAFLSVETFSLRPSWRALLRRKLVVASASADGLKVRLVKNADGSFNYDTLASSAPAAAPPVKNTADAPPGELDIRSLRVTRGEIDYRAPEGNWTAAELALKLDDFSLSEPFDLDLSLRAKGRAGERPVDAILGFSGTVHPARGERGKIKLEIRRLSAEQDGLKLTAKGRVTGLDAPDAELDASLTAAGKTVLELKGTARAAAPGASGVSLVDADLAFKTSGLDTTLIAKWVPQAGIPALVIPAAEGTLAGSWDGAAADVKSARVKWPGGEIEGSGSARGLGTAKTFYGGKAKFGLDLPELTAAKHPFLKLPPKAVIPAMRLDGSATYGADGELALTALNAKFKQGTASASGAIHKLGSAKPVPDLTLRFAVDLPSFEVSELPVAVTALPPGFVVPATRLDGGALVKGDDLYFDKASFKGKSGTLRLDGSVLKALAGAPEPDLEIAADLDLPALTDKDLPFPGVPPGLELPPSRWDMALSYTPKAIRIGKLGVKIGSNDLSVTGGVSDPAGRGAFDLIFKCEKFVLEELTRATPQTRDMKLSGSGKFALAVTGTTDKPVYNGKLVFSGLGATVADLPLSGFSGTLRVDPDMLNISDLKGKVADGSLTMFLTITDYTKVPNIELGASLDRFDLGKFLAAQKRVQDGAKAAQTATAAKSGKPVETRPASPFRTSGKVEIGSLIHPNAQLQKVTAAWDMWGVTPDMKKLNGEATIGVGGGKLRALGDLALQSPVAKVLLYPILIVQRIKFDADLNNMDVVGIVGDYAFKDGLMTMRRSELDAGDAAQVSTVGTIDLPTERLKLLVSANILHLPGVEVAVTGTVAKPETDVKYLKILQNAGKNLGENGKNILKGLNSILGGSQP